MEDDGGLFNIEVSSSDEATTTSKLARDHQSEGDFAKQKCEWLPKTEKGKLWTSLDLPLNCPSKPESQSILHAVEELYFFRSYEDAASLVRRALEGELQDDFRRTLEDYHSRCRAKLAATGS